MRHTPGFILMVAALVSWPALSAAQNLTRRHAIVIGANDGGAERVKLRYARGDARAIAAVLTEMGGVPERQLRLLEDPNRADIEAAISQLAQEAQRARQRGDRIELIFYYSGHSDDAGLLLGEERYGYRALRRDLSDLPVDVRVVILDSCASGNLTRAKGGKRTPAFLQDDSTKVTGHAFLTSSSADEVAQESDRLGGSFFTHYLLSGLRGAADTTGDRRVTLNEVYQFAFNETLARTEHTMGGAQHPAYDIQLSGHGDLVLTEYSQGAAVLRISGDVSGRLYIRGEDGELIAELYKQRGRQVELGLPPATYQIQRTWESAASEAIIDLARGETSKLTLAMFEATSMEVTRARGTAAIDERAQVVPEGPPASPDRAVGLDFVPGLGTSLAHPRARRRLSLNAIGGLSGEIRGFELGGVFNLVRGPVTGVELAGVTNLTRGPLRGVQVAGAFNATASMRGVQLAPINLHRGYMRGAQLGAFNLSTRGGRGLQLGAINLAAGTGEVHGGQVGAINVAPHVRGLQMGAVNVATGEATGFMLGAINIAPRSNAAIGAINFFWDGETHLMGWLNSEGTLQAGVRHGSDYIYNVYHMGIQPTRPWDTGAGAQTSRFLLGMTLGGRFALRERLDVNLDLSANWMVAEQNDWGEANMLHKARASARFELRDWFAIYAGPTFNVLVAPDRETHGMSPPGSWEATAADSPVQVKLWPGLFVGVDFL